MTQDIYVLSPADKDCDTDYPEGVAYTLAFKTHTTLCPMPYAIRLRRNDKCEIFDHGDFVLLFALLKK